MEVWGGNQAEDCGVVMSGLDAWLYSRPYQGDAEGGDVHYVSSCATGRITRVLLADVSGHGAEVAEAGGKLRQLMRRYVNHLDQSSFVVALNREFGAMSSAGRFATSVVGTFFAPTNRLTLSSAGHLPPLRYSRRHKSWSTLRASPDTKGLPLGVLDSQHFGTDDVQLRVGDLVLLYTDSLTESADADGKLLGTEGLLELVRELDVTRPDELIGVLLQRIAAIRDGNLEGDDVTVLLIRPNGLAPRVPWGRRLGVPFRLAGALLGSLRPGGKVMPWPQFSFVNTVGWLVGPVNRLWRPRGDD